jgi:hypothetical protein
VSEEPESRAEEDWEGRPLAPPEIRTLREIMRDWARYKWGWGFLLRIVQYTAAAVGFVYVFHDVLVRIWNAVFPG